MLALSDQIGYILIVKGSAEALLHLWRRMETIERLKELCLPVIEECSVKLYEMKWHGSGNDRTLEVSVMYEDGHMDLDTCALISERLSDVLDGLGTMQNSYTLDVCSPGAEREIRSTDELEQLDEPYIYLRLKHPLKKNLEWYGTVLSAGDGKIVLQYRDKAAVREAEIPYDEIDFMRMAVKF